MEKQPVYQTTTQGTKINPSSNGYIYWHALNQFKAQIERVMAQIEECCEGDSSIDEKYLYNILKPVFFNVGTFFSNIKNIVESQDKKDERA